MKRIELIVPMFCEGLNVKLYEMVEDDSSLSEKSEIIMMGNPLFSYTSSLNPGKEKEFLQRLEGDYF